MSLCERVRVAHIALQSSVNPECAEGRNLRRTGRGGGKRPGRAIPPIARGEYTPDSTSGRKKGRPLKKPQGREAFFEPPGPTAKDKIRGGSRARDSHPGPASG